MVKLYYNLSPRFSDEAYTVLQQVRQKHGGHSGIEPEIEQRIR